MSEKWTIIIAGGRDADEAEALAVLDRDLDPSTVALVVSGCARGWDRAGEEWARRHGIPVERFKPDWSRGGRGGPERNERMACFAASRPPAALYFGPGGKGTKDIVERALRYSLRVRPLVP